MGVPIIFVGKGLVDTVVEVFVVGEDNVAADVVELTGVNNNVGAVGGWATYETFRRHVGGGQSTRRLIGIHNQP